MKNMASWLIPKRPKVCHSKGMYIGAVRWAHERRAGLRSFLGLAAVRQGKAPTLT